MCIGFRVHRLFSAGPVWPMTVLPGASDANTYRSRADTSRPAGTQRHPAATHADALILTLREMIRMSSAPDARRQVPTTQHHRAPVGQPSATARHMGGRNCRSLAIIAQSPLIYFPLKDT